MSQKEKHKIRIKKEKVKKRK